jgi:pentatricopeptide repeat protein
VAEAIRAACFKTASQSYEDAGLQGLCEEGRWEVALDAMKSMDLKPIVEQALRKYVSELP